MKNLITCLVVSVLSGVVFADTWTVGSGGDFSTIQSAINASVNGDEIIVMPGTYGGSGTEVVNMNGKSIWLHSSNGPTVTTISGGNARRGVSCDSNATIEGFTIANGYVWSGEGSNGGGMYCTGNATVINCIFKDNIVSRRGGGLYTRESSPTFLHCTFKNNTCLVVGGGACNDDANAVPLFTNCIFTENHAGDAQNPGAGIWITFGGEVSLRDTTVCGNTGVGNQQIHGTYNNLGGNTISVSCPNTDDDEDGIPDYSDNCYLYNPDQLDCNLNYIGDVCDVADGTSFDCDQNNVPDECQPDCDGDGWIDACDNDADIDNDGIPDNCEEDCNGNTLPDHWEIEMGWVEDCNVNLIPDECDIEGGLEEDCNGNNIPDSCELEDPNNDQNNNGELDECECVGDVDLDGYVNRSDLLIVIGYWGNNIPQADLNFDGIVNVVDLLIVIGNWGACE